VETSEGVSHYWNLVAVPFALTPDPNFVYETDGFREALGRLFYNVVELRGGLSVITGGPGIGKTTLSRAFLRELPRDRYRPALVVNPCMPATQLLGAVLQELGVDPPPRSKTERLDAFVALLQRLESEGREPVVVLDEAHEIGPTVLNELRMLLNYEGDDRKLFHLVLVGLPNLERNVRANAGLAQRVTAWCRLEPLTTEEVARYVEHRLKVAGSDGRPFQSRAVSRIAKVSGGVPRRINAIASTALYAGAAGHLRAIAPHHVDAAAAELDGAVKEEQ
jgi:type II secretory pathway predicted ATPase ExeA